MSYTRANSSEPVTRARRSLGTWVVCLFGGLLVLLPEVTAAQSGKLTSSAVASLVAGPTLQLQSSTPGTVSTGNFHIDGTGMAGVLQAGMIDAGGQVFNVWAFGAMGDGATDDTNAIQATILAAASVNGTVFFSYGTYNTTGNFDISAYSGVHFLGSGQGATRIRITHPTNSLFRWGSANISLCSFRHFTVVSDTVTRTDGWVIGGTSAWDSGTGFAYHSTIDDVGMENQKNGISITKGYYNNVSNCSFSSGVGDGVAFRFGQIAAGPTIQGSDSFVTNNHVRGDGVSPSIGFLIQDFDAPYFSNNEAFGCADNSLKVEGGGWGVNNSFFTQFIADETRNGPTALVTGTIINRMRMQGCWFASSGHHPGGSAAAQGLKIDANSVRGITINACQFVVNNGSGLYIETGSVPMSVVSNNVFDSNGAGAVESNHDGITMVLGPGGASPTVIGNVESGSSGVGIRTSATVTKLQVIGNNWGQGSAYGAPPLSASGNLGD